MTPPLQAVEVFRDLSSSEKGALERLEKMVTGSQFLRAVFVEDCQEPSLPGALIAGIEAVLAVGPVGGGAKIICVDARLPDGKGGKDGPTFWREILKSLGDEPRDDQPDGMLFHRVKSKLGQASAWLVIDGFEAIASDAVLAKQIFHTLLSECPGLHYVLACYADVYSTQRRLEIVVGPALFHLRYEVLVAGKPSLLTLCVRKLPERMRRWISGPLQPGTPSRLPSVQEVGLWLLLAVVVTLLMATVGAFPPARHDQVPLAMLPGTLWALFLFRCAGLVFRSVWPGAKADVRHSLLASLGLLGSAIVLSLVGEGVFLIFLSLVMGEAGCLALLWAMSLFFRELDR